MNLPELKTAQKINTNSRKLYVGAYGFEDRTLGWVNYQQSQGCIIDNALMFEYNPSKGQKNNPNKIGNLREALKNIGVNKECDEIIYDWQIPQDIENLIEDYFYSNLNNIDEVIVDISSMTKFLILVCLCKLSQYQGQVRIVYSEAENYSPSLKEYERSKGDMAFLAKYPSQGVRAIARARCISSIRMQGQPVILITFTSFNEQLVRHLLGTMNPHRLIFINGRPPREDFAWREKATQEVHKSLIESYQLDNETDMNGLLLSSVSTLNYIETVEVINNIYTEHGGYERLICGATGSKMQTVGLFFTKMLHPDIHIEYPTPDSYYVEGFSTDIRKIHEIVFPDFSDFIKKQLMPSRNLFLS